MSAKFRFGAYELDVAGMELRKSGVRIRLQDQPFRILAALVDRPGEVVTRAELKTQVWADGTFVDFDQSLNKAVNRLREVLDDDPSQPRYIETIPRHGYRFVAHVTDLTPPRQIPDRPVPGPGAIEPHRSWVVIMTIGVLAMLVLAGTVAITRSLHVSRKVSTETPQIITPDALSPALSTDGKLLAYVSKVGGDVPHIWVRQTAGGKSVQVTRGAFRDSDPDFSPDSTQIVFSSLHERQGVYLTPTFPGDPKLVLADSGWPRFSPDGKSILCVRPDGRMLVVANNDTQPARIQVINPDFQTDGPPLWSSSGREIIFWGRQKNEPATSNHWFVASLSGAAPKRLAIPVLEPGHHTQGTILSWTQISGRETLMMYSIQERDIWSLFRLRISNGDAPVGEPEQLLSGPGLLGHVAAIGNVGRLVYAVTSLNEQIFEIPVDNQGNRRGPVTELPLTEGALYFSPSASRDGRSMVYTQEELGKHSIILRDFAAGTNRVIEEQSQTGFPAASIAPDGSKIVFNRHCWCQATVLDCPSFLVPATGGQAKRICENCTPRGFSSDGSFILMQHYAWDKNEDKITAVELAKNRERDFARSRSNSVYHAFLSWDDRWVAFKKLLGTTQAQILIAQVRDGHAAAESEWIVVTDGHSSDDKPQFSPDGNSVYFTSDRDGYLCIWKQRLDPLSKHPVGSAMGYEHFHNSMGRDAASDPRYLFLSDLTVARDKILINLPRGRGDIWMAHVN